MLIPLACACVVMRALLWVYPRTKQKLEKVMDEVTPTDMSQFLPTDWEKEFFKWSFFKTHARNMLINLHKSVNLNGPAANVDVITLDGNATQLMDYSSDPERPLVVNFGSCT